MGYQLSFKLPHPTISLPHLVLLLNLDLEIIQHHFKRIYHLPLPLDLLPLLPHPQMLDQELNLFQPLPLPLPLQYYQVEVKIQTQNQLSTNSTGWRRLMSLGESGELELE